VIAIDRSIQNRKRTLVKVEGEADIFAVRSSLPEIFQFPGRRFIAAGCSPKVLSFLDIFANRDAQLLAVEAETVCRSAG